MEERVVLFVVFVGSSGSDIVRLDRFLQHVSECYHLLIEHTYLSAESLALEPQP